MSEIRSCTYTNVPENSNSEKINKNVQNEEIDQEVAESADNSQAADDGPYLFQSVDGDDKSVNETDVYLYGGENPSVAVMKSKDLVSKNTIDAASVQVAPGVNVYNANVYDNHDRHILTTPGAEVTLYEDKVKDEVTGNDKVKNHLSAFYQQQQLEHFDIDPDVTYGLDYKFDNSSVKKKLSTDAKDFKKEDEQIGKFEINTEWKKNEGLQKVSFGSEIGHGTILKLGKEGEFRTAGLTHEKKSANHENNIQEEFQLKYKDKKNYSLNYSVDNKGITKWGLSAEKQDGVNRYGIFFNKPL